MTGSAGIANQAALSTVPTVAEEYGAMVEAARDAALAKREGDLADLHAIPNLSYPGEHAAGRP